MKLIKTTRWLSGIPAFITVCILALVHVQLYQYAFDDAFIHFRVVRNFLNTGVPFYNVNEMVKVSTSSGWTIFLIVLFELSHLLNPNGNFPLIVGVANALISFSGVLVYTKIIEVLFNHRLTLFTKLLFQIPFLVLLLPASVGLMETPLALLFAGLGIYFLVIKVEKNLLNYMSLGMIGVAAYIRLELLILLILAAFALVIKKEISANHIIGLGIPVLPLLFYDLYYFNTIIPHSVIAKSIVYSISELQSAMYILFISFPTTISSGYGLAVNGVLFLGVIVITTKLIFQSLKKISVWHIIFYIWGVSVIAGYVLGHAQIFEWYRAIYTIPIFVSSFLFLENKENVIVKIVHYVLFLTFSVSLITIIYASVYNPGAFGYFAGGSRVKVYLYVGKILHDEYPNSRLLTSEIGGLGYSFTGRVIDAAGLASPDALDFHPMKIPAERANGDIGAIPPNYVKAKMPELIVSYDYFAQALLADGILEHYNIVQIPAYLPEDAIYSESKMIWDSRYMRVYIRKDLPVSRKILVLGN